jgi:hypothetical protein
MVRSDSIVMAENLVKNIKKMVEQGLLVPLDLIKVETIDHAHQVICNHIDQIQSKTTMMGMNLNRLREMAMARFYGKNYKGAVMSMRNYYKLLIEYKTQNALITALTQLDHNVCHDVVHVDRYEKEMNQIIAFFATQTKANQYHAQQYDDRALLHKLAKGEFVAAATIPAL